MKPVLCLALISLVLVSCGVVLIQAPPDRDIKLLADADAATYKTSIKNWYFLWGLIPLSNTSTEEIIQNKGLKNIRAKTYYSFVDFIVECFTGGIVWTNTTSIEGNTK
jgi:hypothetical protein